MQQRREFLLKKKHFSQELGGEKEKKEYYWRSILMIIENLKGTLVDLLVDSKDSYFLVIDETWLMLHRRSKGFIEVIRTTCVMLVFHWVLVKLYALYVAKINRTIWWEVRNNWFDVYNNIPCVIPQVRPGRLVCTRTIPYLVEIKRFFLIDPRLKKDLNT